MSTTVEDITSTKKRLKIEIPTEVIEKEYKSSLDSVRQKAKIPGFRAGKIPVNIIEKKFGGDIRADIIDRLVPEYYSKALKEAELVPVTMPTFESSLDIKRNEPLSFSLTVEVRPDVGELNFIGMKVEDIPVQVDDEEIKETLKGLQEEKAVYDAVDREVRKDDLLVIDYVKLDPSGKKELSSAKDQVMNLGNELAPAGLLDELVGRKKGETVDITLPSFEGGAGDALPAEEAGNQLRITIKEVKVKRLPEIDDEFAKDLGYDNLELLSEKIKEGLLKAKKDSAAKKQKQQLLDTLAALHEFEVPESLLREELEKLVVNEKLSQKKPNEQLQMAGSEKMTEEAEDAEREERLRPAAIKNAKSTILLDMIAEKESVAVTEEEMKTRILLLAQQLKTTPDVVINLLKTKDGSLENFRHSIRDEKVLDLVLSKAKITKGA